jgi:UDP-N-acetylglucosamine 2-epimerase (non-hydrolysing)
VLSDSGTVQEEACILGVPSVTIRDTTERPETIECGSNVLSGIGTQMILKAVELVTGTKRSWEPPTEYLVPHVSNTVLRIVLGFCFQDVADIESADPFAREDVTTAS